MHQNKKMPPCCIILPCFCSWAPNYDKPSITNTLVFRQKYTADTADTADTEGTADMLSGEKLFDTLFKLATTLATQFWISWLVLWISWEMSHLGVGSCILYLSHPTFSRSSQPVLTSPARLGPHHHHHQYHHHHPHHHHLHHHHQPFHTMLHAASIMLFYFRSEWVPADAGAWCCVPPDEEHHAALLQLGWQPHHQDPPQARHVLQSHHR